MKVTTKDILAFLPFDQDYKNKLQEQLNSPDLDKKLAIADILWEAFDQFYELRVQENLRAAIQNVKDSGEIIDDNFYKKIEQETKKEIENEMATKSTDYDLSSVREKLQKIMDKEPDSEPKKVN